MSEVEKGLPEGWAWAQLGDTGEYFNGMAFKPADWEDVGRPIIRIQNLNNPEKPINRTTKEVRERYLVQAGDLLVSWSATLDAFKWLGEEAVLNQHIFNVRPKPELDKQFIFHTLKFQIRVLIDSEHMHGSTMRHINRKPFMSHRIPLPPLAEQSRIVDKIDELFSSIEAGERAIARARTALTRYRKAVLKAAVTGELTADWREQNPPTETAEALLKRILKARYAAWEKAELEKLDAKGKAHPKIDKEWVKFRGRYRLPVELDTEGSPETPKVWARITGEYLFGWTSGKFLPKKSMLTGDIPVYGGNGINGHHAQANCVEPTIIIGRVGVHCGNIHRVSKACWITDNAIYANSISQMANLQYQELVLKNARLGDFSQGGAQPFVNQKTLNEAFIPFPPINEQAEIVSRVEEALSKADKVEATLDAQARQAKALKQAVLKTAFEGKLVPQNPKDEPASELLKRIKEEK